MRITWRSLQILLVAVLFPTALGCGSKKTALPAASEPAAAVPHHHDHGATRGPHGGNVIGFDTEQYHAEVTLDAPANRVGVYILGEDAVTTLPLEGASITIDVKEYDKSAQYVLPPAAQVDDASGKSSYFEIVSEPLATALAGQSEDPNAQVQLNLNVGGKSNVGYLDIHDAAETMAHGHSHAADDALVWLQELKEQGFDIAVGHHGVTILAGGKVEPAVQITRDGTPVTDAKVFNSLLAEDGTTVLREELATVYEPPSDEEPSHYAQAMLEIPGGTRNLVIRYRIVLPEGKGERTIDVPVSVK
jgi:hypothetical protein